MFMERAPFTAKAFTLTELLVAVALLATVGGVVGQVFVFNSQTMERTTNMTNVQDNLRFILNVLDKELRTADPSSIEDNPANGEIKFTTQENETVTYRLQNNALQKEIGSSNTVNLTDDKILRITEFNVTVEGSESSQPQPAKVVTQIRARVASRNDSTGDQLADQAPFDIQTTTVLRNYDKDFLTN